MTGEMNEGHSIGLAATAAITIGGAAIAGLGVEGAAIATGEFAMGDAAGPALALGGGTIAKGLGDLMTSEVS